MRSLYPLVAALALIVAAAPSALAQPAAAVGKPLPDASLRDGTVTVRVIAGDRGKPVTGADVVLSMSPPTGTAPPIVKTARTDADGRATFPDVAEGALVKLTTAGLDGADIASAPFPMPQTGGIRMLLSTVPMDGGGAPTMGGGKGPMTPRVMSGQPRPEPADDRDAITVRVSYDDFADAAPLDGVPIALVGYKHDLSISGRIVVTDAAGRAEFRGLDPRGATSYFAMTLLPRNGAFDRLTSVPILLGGESGVRVMLSGDKRAATTPPIDDLGRLDEQPRTATIAPGEIRALLSGVPESGTPVELVDALTGTVVTTVPAGPPLADLDGRAASWTTVDPGTVTGSADPALAAGSLAVAVSRGGAPVVGTRVALTIVPPAQAPSGWATPAAPPPAITDAAGTVTFAGLPLDAEVDVTVALEGEPLPPHRVKLGRAGTRVAATLTWSSRGEGGARFTGVAGGPERVYAVRTTMRGQTYVSAPFQLTADRGTSITVLIMPRVMFSFSLTSWIDDVYFGARGSFGIRNASWAPYVAQKQGRPDELVLPLPTGFTGAIVRDDFAEFVGIDPTRGFVIRRPIPPGGYQFIAGFSMPIEDGELAWDMALPLGAFESGIEIKRDQTDVKVEVPGNVRGVKVEEAEDERGRFFVLSPITILPGKTMSFRLHDLPRPPAWQTAMKRIGGVLVLLALIATTVFALWRPRRAAPAARFDTLLDELAVLEASGAEPERRARLLAELEALYRAAGPPR